MPKFYIDSYDGRTAIADNYGIDLESVEEAADEAAALLPVFARESIPSTQSQAYIAAVRNEDGAIVYHSALLFQGIFSEEPDVRYLSMSSDHFSESMRLNSLIADAQALTKRVEKATHDFWLNFEELKKNVDASR